MPTFVTPYSGSAELAVSNGLEIISQGRWAINRTSINDGATLGVSLGGPERSSGGFYYGPGPGAPAQIIDSGELHLRAENWPIADIGNDLTSYTPPGGPTYGPERCRILVTGRWQVIRQPNSDSFNSQGVLYKGRTVTDQGDRDMDPWLLNFTSGTATYVIQGADVSGGALDTFTNHVFFCRITESATTDNSNREFQSNSIARPVWAYSYSKSWQTD